MDKKYFLDTEDGRIVVSEEVYRAYKQPEWRESKQFKVRKEKECSLESFSDFGYNIPVNQKSVEDMLVDKQLKIALHNALSRLDKSERTIIIARYFKNKSERELAKEMGIPRKTLSYRTEKILAKLYDLLKNF